MVQRRAFELYLLRHIDARVQVGSFRKIKRLADTHGVAIEFVPSERVPRFPRFGEGLHGVDEDEHREKKTRHILVGVLGLPEHEFENVYRIDGNEG